MHQSFIKENFPEIILGSASPRRKELLNKMGFSFVCQPVNINEKYPQNIPVLEVAEYISKMKMKALINNTNSTNKILLTADTTVCFNNKIIGKPKTKKEGILTLKKLSGNFHLVSTSCVLKYNKKELVFSEHTKVYFNKLSDDIISYYIEKDKPFDKAGSYGIQDWIGLIAINKIIGSYNNVVGLPTDTLYNKLITIVN